MNHELNKNDSQLLEVNLLNQLKLAKRVNLFDYSFIKIIKDLVMILFNTYIDKKEVKAMLTVFRILFGKNAKVGNLSLRINIMQRENVQLFVSKVLT
ncbi:MULTISPECIES: hypothetical protein [Clostridia]|uniref:hypothetical protein n=1 Tax=Clostridia TaxID=186801 RepID=UPI000EAB649E|nr:MULTISPECIES: hypothetical protein [Clostridia]RKQ23114.1 hypothetical protein D8Q48_15680 [Ruminococcus sp. B05]